MDSLNRLDASFIYTKTKKWITDNITRVYNNDDDVDWLQMFIMIHEFLYASCATSSFQIGSTNTYTYGNFRRERSYMPTEYSNYMYHLEMLAEALKNKSYSMLLHDNVFIMLEKYKDTTINILESKYIYVRKLILNSRGITDLQCDIALYVRSCNVKNHCGPTYQQIMYYVKVTSRHTIVNNVNKLIAAGILERTGNKKNNLRYIGP